MNPKQAIQQEYVFDRHCVLPNSDMTLTVLRGDAWVFSEGKNFILHTGEQYTISSHRTPPIIRRAYTRGFAKFQIELTR
mgnify:CR=1 FL=1